MSIVAKSRTLVSTGASSVLSSTDYYIKCYGEEETGSYLIHCRSECRRSDQKSGYKKKMWNQEELVGVSRPRPLLDNREDIILKESSKDYAKRRRMETEGRVDLKINELKKSKSVSS